MASLFASSPVSVGLLEAKAANTAMRGAYKVAGRILVMGLAW